MIGAQATKRADARTTSIRRRVAVMDRCEGERRQRLEQRRAGRREVVAEDVRRQRDGHPGLRASGDHGADGDEHRPRGGDEDLVDDLPSQQVLGVDELVDRHPDESGIVRHVLLVEMCHHPQAPVGIPVEDARDLAGAGTRAQDQDVAVVAPEPAEQSKRREDPEP
jgi:hypothetical protein